MRTKGMIALVGLLLFGIPGSTRASEDIRASLANTYEQLANAILAIKETESALVGTMLMFHYESAEHELQLAMSGDAAAKKAHLEAAAAEITYLANEGDKAVQAVVQRMLKAGHHHHTDGMTREDYMFVDSVEKQTLLALAGKIARMDGSNTSEVQGAMDELTRLYQSAVEPD
ncbi:MAG: hypothetical protein R3B81_01615 [bacterium]